MHSMGGTTERLTTACPSCATQCRPSRPRSPSNLPLCLQEWPETIRSAMVRQSLSFSYPGQRRSRSSVRSRPSASRPACRQIACRRSSLPSLTLLAHDFGFRSRVRRPGAPFRNDAPGQAGRKGSGGPCRCSGSHPLTISVGLPSPSACAATQPTRRSSGPHVRIHDRNGGDDKAMPSVRDGAPLDNVIIGRVSRCRFGGGGQGRPGGRLRRHDLP